MNPISTIRDLVSCVDRQAAERPDQIAVTHAGASSTYAQLVADSYGVARRLAGLGPGAVVGVAAHRGIASIVAELAALRAGATYVVLDPAHPVRAGLVAADAGCVAVLSEPGLPPLPGLDGVPTIDIGHLPGAPWAPAVHPDLPAYICYTSGTTGRPKGVLVPRRAITSFIDQVSRLWWPKPGEAMAGVCDATWDPWMFDVWVPLVHGCHLHLIPDDERRNPAAIARYLASHDIAALFMPTAIGELVLDSPLLRTARSLRNVVLGGDRLTRRPQPGESFALWNLYGPTEAAVGVIVGLVEAEGEGFPSLGPALPGVGLTVVDDGLRPVPDGQEGELLIDGAQLSYGYLGRPRETALAFVPADGGGRRYRTGDFVRRRPDGRFAFVGRRDRQVSIHGARIELEGVEALVRRLPGTLDVAATAHRPANGDLRLTVLVVPDGAGTGVGTVRAALREHLPGAGGSLDVRVVPRLPRRADGSLDTETLRAALDTAPIRAVDGAVRSRGGPAPDRADEDPDTAPPSEIEEIVLTAWRSALGLAEAAPDDDFFACGGTSLSAMRMLNQVQAAFDVEVSIGAFLDDPTARHLGALITAAVEERLDELTADDFGSLREGS
ncbi:non-ribosomal peptide synthetase [Dactylosporangium roseum]|uniref:Non-ribosomal peptide synthetase n=1 Tax=Dactylosporangium roseum TaxID=47989 RepID=A0ABY5ZC18_9ACTN|nr:non-ribosomal peptide synthetase [Dactylosporangium roseum]UWZ39407.1 non-ribosomal peptide synthetase [Dactylosporangium roseum]